VLIASPWLFGFADGSAAMWVPIVVGAGAIAYSLLTDYEYSLVKAIPMPAHLAIDGLSGALLAASPWIFGFSDRVWTPHLVFGIVEIGAAVMTSLTPGRVPATRTA